MITIALWIGLFGYTLPFAASTECIECTSLESMEACVRLAKRVQCPRPTDRCRNMTVQVYVQMIGENITAYERGCASQYECIHGRCDRNFGKGYLEKPGTYNMCDMMCCTGDLCPEGNVTIRAGTPGGPVKGARGGSEAIHPVAFSVTASALLSLINAYFM